MYEENLIKNINKALKDEITASIIYLTMAENSTEPFVTSQLKEHAEAEYTHFKKIISYACSHGLDSELKIELDNEVLGFKSKDLKEIIKKAQELEQIAIEDYRYLTSLARKNNDFEAEDFFKDIMKEEMEHFDDLATLTQEKRKIKSFKDFLK